MFFYNILVFFYLYYLILGVIYIHGRIIYFFTHDKTIMKTKHSHPIGKEKVER